MIVDPDFFDHWRTRMVADMLKDQLAPVYIMRLWAHCQNRKGDVFDIPAAGLKALCQFSGAAQELEDALVAAEYIARDGLTVTVTGWAEKNAALLAAWENGHKGGRPKKNQNTTDGQPTENPAETHGLPMANPSLTQTKPIRVDKRREEDNPLNPPAGGKARRRCRIPDGFNPSEDGRQRAVQAGLDADAEIAKFRDHHAAKGSLMADWDAAWRTWVGNAVQFGRAKVQSPSAKPDTPEYAALHKNASWWRDAGFPSVWEAMANKCWHTNAHLFRDGKRIEVAA
jgi:hypothetical protein